MITLNGLPSVLDTEKRCIKFLYIKSMYSLSGFLERFYIDFSSFIYFRDFICILRLHIFKMTEGSLWQNKFDFQN